MNKRIIREFEVLFDLDQEHIQKYKTGLIDSKKFSQLQSCIARRATKLLQQDDTFPYKDQAGEKAYYGAVLAAHHSGDISFLNSILGQIKNRKDHEVNRKDVAYLSDRVCILQGKPQVFGTQYRVEDQKIVFLPIQNKDFLDKCRADIGLEKFSLYIERVKVQTGIESVKYEESMKTDTEEKRNKIKDGV